MDKGDEDDASEAWRHGNSGSSDFRPSSVSAYLQAMPVYSPLRRVGGFVRRLGESFSAFTWIECSDKTAFNDLSAKITALVHPNGVAWEPTDIHGQGYFVNADGIVVSSLLALTDTTESDRRVCIGMNGASQRPFNPASFKESLSELERATNLVVSACLPEEVRKLFLARRLFLQT